MKKEENNDDENESIIDLLEKVDIDAKTDDEAKRYWYSNSNGNKFKFI